MVINWSLLVALSFADTVHDAVGVDVELDLDLWHALRRGRNADEVEVAEQLVVVHELALALGRS